MNSGNLHALPLVPLERYRVVCCDFSCWNTAAAPSFEKEGRCVQTLLPKMKIPSNDSTFRKRFGALSHWLFLVYFVPTYLPSLPQIESLED